jgi:hypothetical protein
MKKKGYIILNHTINIKIGVIYLIYLLYNTQKNTPKVKIDVTTDVYEEMLKLKKYAIQSENKELYTILKHLKKERSLNYTSYIRVDPMLSSLKIDKKM